MKIIEEEKFVTALFFDESQTSNDVLTGFRTFQPLNFQPQASSPDFSTKDFWNKNSSKLMYLKRSWTGIVLGIVIVLKFASIFIAYADWGKQGKEKWFKIQHYDYA